MGEKRLLQFLACTVLLRKLQECIVCERTIHTTIGYTSELILLMFFTSPSNRFGDFFNKVKHFAMLWKSTEDKCKDNCFTSFNWNPCRKHCNVFMLNQFTFPFRFLRLKKSWFPISDYVLNLGSGKDTMDYDLRCITNLIGQFVTDYFVNFYFRFSIRSSIFSISVMVIGISN